MLHPKNNELMNWAIFCMLTLHLWLLKASLQQLYLFEPLCWRGIWSVHPSVLHLSGCFLEIGSLDFCEFRQSRSFWKNFFALKLGNCPEIGQKQGFLNLKKKMIINFLWICFITKIDICCVFAKILYWEKILSVSYMPKCFQVIRLQYF